jgi:hypothetical protein
MIRPYRIFRYKYGRRHVPGYLDLGRMPDERGWAGHDDDNDCVRQGWEVILGWAEGLRRPDVNAWKDV